MHLQLAVVAKVRGGGELRGRAFYRPSEEEGRGRRGGRGRRARGRALMAAGPAVAHEATLVGGGVAAWR